ncbi:hypothetical protein ACFWY9_04195 [Amycolatopsis sp. NPDC059027]|uniref:hypothetical protein n=1 Tax=Amycolatopsis sp. NPDC059027 TaxID=3346709 RepID=UPI00366F5868
MIWPAAPAAQPDNVVPAGQVLDLRGSAATRLLAGAAANGDHRVTATVTFTDGTVGQADLSFGDWVFPGGATTRVFENTRLARTDHRNPRGTGTSVYASTPCEAPAGRTPRHDHDAERREPRRRHDRTG